MIGLPIPVIVKSFNKFYAVVKKKDASILVKDRMKPMVFPRLPVSSEDSESLDGVILKGNSSSVFSMSENEEGSSMERRWKERRTRKQRMSRST